MKASRKTELRVARRLMRYREMVKRIGADRARGYRAPGSNKKPAAKLQPHEKLI